MTGAVWVLLVLSPVAAIGFVVWKRRLDASGQTTAFRYFAVENARDLFVPLAILTIAYAALAWIVAGHDADTTAIGAIRKLEERIQFLHQTTRMLKLRPLATLVGLVAFVLVGIYARYLSSPIVAKGLSAGYKGFARYQKVARVAMVTATALASFTFFSEHSEGLARRLQLRAKAADESYRELVADAAVLVERRVSTGVAVLVKDHAPPSYQRMHAVWKAHVEAKRQLVHDYPIAAKRYRFSWPPAEKLASAYEAGSERIAELVEEIDVRVASRRFDVELPDVAPPEATSAEIDQLHRNVRFADGEAVPDGSRIFDDPAGKKIIPALLGIIIDPKRLPFVDRLVTEIPLLDPFLEVFRVAMSKYSGERATAAARHWIEDWLRSRADPTRQQASDPVGPILSDIAADLPATWSTLPPANLDRASAILDADRRQLQNVKASLDAAAQRARPAADAFFHGENVVLRLEVSVALSVRTGLNPLVPGERERYALIHRPLDEFLAEAHRSNDPWREHEILKAAADELERTQSYYGGLLALSVVAVRQMPGSAAQISLDRAVERARPSDSDRRGSLVDRPAYRSSEAPAYRPEAHEFRGRLGPRGR